MKKNLFILLFLSLNILGCSSLKKASPLASPLSSQKISLQFLSDVTYKTGAVFKGTEIGGLSSLVYHPETNLLWALSDDRGSKGIPRIYQFSVELPKSKGRLSSINLIPQKITFLKLDEQNELPNLFVDPESLVFLSQDHFLVSSEGFLPLLPPSLIEFNSQGWIDRVWNVPSPYVDQKAEGLRTQGITSNGAFEGVTITADKKYLYAGVEWPLIQDAGARPWGRILSYRQDQGKNYLLENEFLYELTKDHGLTELYALDATNLLALERGYDPATKKQTAFIFRINLGGASDISGVSSLNDPLVQKKIEKGEIRPVKKEVILDLDDIKKLLKKPQLDNLEGMTLGPRLINGHPTLIIVSDNNFNPEQRTLFLFFEVLGLP